MLEISFVENLPLWRLLILFSLASLLVWLSGSKLSVYADNIAVKYNLSYAFIGALLLGGITSLPEVVTTITGSLLGSPSLVVNNILGGVAFQTAILAIADMFSKKRSIALSLSGNSVNIQAVFVIVLLVIVLVGIVISEIITLDFPLVTSLVFVAFLYTFYITKKIYSKELTDDEQSQNKNSEAPVVPWMKFYLCAVTILIAGFFIPVIGKEIATQTGISENVVGAILIAFSTSAPELSATISAVRIGRSTLAASNIFGTNLITVALLFLADMFYTKGSILNHIKMFSQFAALLGILLTSIFVLGFLIKPKWKIIGMSIESLLVIVCYVFGLIIFYLLQ